MHSSLFPPSAALLTDVYQLTMAYAFWKNEMQDHEAVYHLTFRSIPFKGGYALAAGLETLIHYLEEFRFTPADIDYLSSLKGNDGKALFSESFLEYLLGLELSCDLDAIPEGSVVFPQEPLLRVKGPLIEAQILESAILNLMNYQTLVATKASRICAAAGSDPVLEFGLRRAQGLDGALSGARAAYIGGCVATSTVLAGKRYGIPLRGTMAHSWIMAQESEIEAFENYAQALPNNCIFLVDTYHTLEGVKNAIRIAKEMRQEGKELMGIRLDSGDLTYLSIESRKLLDEAGFPNALIVASNELDETIISDLKHQGAKINAWGVGTKLITASDQPALDGVYKLSAIRSPDDESWRYPIKISEQMLKVSTPGILQVRRYMNTEGHYIGDAVFNQEHGLGTSCTIIDPLDATKTKEFDALPSYRDLLVPLFREGKRVYTIPSLEEVQKRAKEEIQNLHPTIRRFINPHRYVVGLEKSLHEHKTQLIHEIRSRRKQVL